jgi:hypothetical protein
MTRFAPCDETLPDIMAEAAVSDGRMRLMATLFECESQSPAACRCGASRGRTAPERDPWFHLDAFQMSRSCRMRPSCGDQNTRRIWISGGVVLSQQHVTTGTPLRKRVADRKQGSLGGDLEANSSALSAGK